MERNITSNQTYPFLVSSPSCFARNTFGFDVSELADPFTKFKPDSFPFGSDWYFFFALHFITGVMFTWLSNIEFEQQKKYKKITEPLAFSMCVLTIGVSVKQMALNYFNESNIYYNIQDISLTLIASFRVITTTSFHMAVIQPTIQKADFLEWKQLTERTYGILCNMLYITLLCFPFLSTTFCPIFPIIVTLHTLLIGDYVRERELSNVKIKVSFLRTTKGKVVFLITCLHSVCMIWAFTKQEQGFFPIQACCQYQNFTFKSIIDWTLYLNSMQNDYVNEKMLSEDIAAQRRKEWEKEKLPKCFRACLIIELIVALAPILAIIVLKSVDYSL